MSSLDQVCIFHETSEKSKGLFKYMGNKNSSTLTELGKVWWTKSFQLFHSAVTGH